MNVLDVEAQISIMALKNVITLELRLSVKDAGSQLRRVNLG
jgi:hypothetical protein